jgi:excisionase family DNA binding protein
MSLQTRFRKPNLEPAAPATNDHAVPRFLTLKQSAEYLGLTLWRVRVLVWEHKLKRIPENTHGYRIPREELDRYAADQVRNSY